MLSALVLLAAVAVAAGSETTQAPAVGLQRTALAAEQRDLLERIARPIGDVALFDVHIPEAEDGIALWIEEYERGETVSGGGRLISTPEHAKASGEAGEDGTYKSQISVWISDLVVDGKGYLRFTLSLGDSSFSLYRELTDLDPSFRAFRSQSAPLEMLKAGPIPLAVYGAYEQAGHSLSTSDAAKAFLRSNWQASKEAAEETVAQYDHSFVVYVQLYGPDDWELRRALKRGDLHAAPALQNSAVAQR